MLKSRRGLDGLIVAIGVCALAWVATGGNVPGFTIAVDPIFETFGSPVVIAEADTSGRITRHVSVPRVIRNDAAWRQALTPGTFAFVRRAATELAYSGKFDNFYERGLYRCVACGTALFASAAKYDSETGWPSFTMPVAGGNVTIVWDTSWGARKKAVRCVRCGSHLGHVFNDGPAPTRRRYCINSAALAFEPAND